MEKNPLTQLILEFLAEIGIPTEERKFETPTFLPGILIDKGVLYYELDQLRYPGDLLHEAGHIALMTPEERPVIVGNVKEYRLPTQDDEMGVMAWTLAACKYLKLPPSIVFHENGYHGQSESLIYGYENGFAPGLPLLVWMGLTSYESFPSMTKWIRDTFPILEE